MSKVDKSLDEIIAELHRCRKCGHPKPGEIALTEAELTRAVVATFQGDEEFFGPKNYAKELWKEIAALSGVPLPEGQGDE